MRWNAWKDIHFLGLLGGRNMCSRTIAVWGKGMVIVTDEVAP